MNATSPSQAAELANVPAYDDMMQTVLDALRAQGGQATNAEIATHVAQRLELPPEVVALIHQPGRNLTRLEYNLMWTRTYLRQFGLIDSPRRGVWALLPAGWQASTVDPREVVRTVRSQLEVARLARDGQAPIFSPDAEGVVPLKLAGDSTPELRILTPSFPTYTNTRHLMRILDGTKAADYQAMAGAILDQRGNPQEPVDWANPDEWIDRRLTGKEQVLAHRIWQGSQRQLNPRHTRGAWYLATKHSMLVRTPDDTLRITERGHEFLEQIEGALVAEIDTYEAVLFVLHLVSEQGTARRSEILPAFGEYCRAQTTFQSENVLKTSLYDRLRNLIERQLIVARGHRYEATDSGLAYLERSTLPAPGRSKPTSKSADLFRLARSLREESRSRLQAYLLDMDAFKFEELVKVLLEEMGYENVATTSPTNDKGVDVVGTIELGISAVREVIQAKRHRGTINRPVLDQLRGSLHRFNAVRGTIITTGKFSKGIEEAAFERGAAPITLIDGEKLLDLLLEYEIGVNKRQMEYFEFAPEKLVQFEAERNGQSAP